MRDSQKEKLYRAERKVTESVIRQGRRWHISGGRLETVPEMQAFCDKVTGSAWFRRTFPRGPFHITANANPGDGKARGGGTRIWMPGWSRCRLIVLHEMAHCIAPRNTPDGEAWHGRGFCRVYLQLVQHHLGTALADRFKEAMRETGARWKVKRKGGPGNPEALARYREERLAAKAREDWALTEA